jgi:signal peptidase II
VTNIEEKPEPVANTPGNQEQSTAKNTNKERWITFVFTALVLVLDYASKEIVRNNLPLYTYWAPFPQLENFFRFTHTINTGVAFGLFQFQYANLFFSIFVTIVSIGIIYFNQKLEPGHKLLRVALGLQLGGALGNLIDRFTQGGVTDFLDFGPWPVFNIADAAVVAGVMLMGYVLLQEDRQARTIAEENLPNTPESPQSLSDN